VRAIRSAVLITVAVFTDEEASFFRENYCNPPPEPAADGAHLKFFWDWWLGIKPETVGLDVAQRWVVDHLRASPNYYWTFSAAFDYPTVDRIGSITQPLLVMAPHDDLWQQMERAIPLLPDHAQLIDMPHVTNEMAVLRRIRSRSSSTCAAFSRLDAGSVARRVQIAIAHRVKMPRRTGIPSVAARRRQGGSTCRP